jgi:cytochrome c oxidase assembly protein subunit 15
MNDHSSPGPAPAVGSPARPGPVIFAWLWVLFAMVFAMVVLGGVTRLTGSGLSMVYWHPLMGVLPPLSESDWQHVFAQYQESPQFREVNSWMTLDSFKRIFFWEYLHRLCGRLIGIVGFVPWLFFHVRKRISPWLSRRVLIAIGLGGLQGLLGWFMVKSGLVDRPEVSQFRLAAHLLLAFFIGQWILWTLLDLHTSRHPNQHGAPPLIRRLVHLAAFLVALQVIYGAFMAGTRAGVLFPTFPDMHGAYAPSHFFPLETLSQNLFHSPITIHYIHRALALVLTLHVFALWWLIRRQPPESMPSWSATPLLIAMLLQSALGGLTVVHQIAIPIAVSHQAAGFFLAATTTLLVHLTHSRNPVAPELTSE